MCINRRGFIQRQKPQGRKGGDSALSPPQQAHGDKEISVGRKGTPEFPHRDRIQHGGDDGYGKDAARKTAVRATGSLAGDWERA